MKNFRQGFPGGSSGSGSSTFPTVMIALLLPLLALLLYLGFRIANTPGESDVAKGRGESYPVGDQPAGADPQPEEAWEKRAELWKKMLEESSETLQAGKGPAREKTSAPALSSPRGAPSSPAKESSSGSKPAGPRALTDQGRKIAGTGLMVDALGGTVRPGESVEIVWCSPDGAVWKKVIDHPVSVQGIDGGAVRISVKAEERKAIDSARLSGKVFAVPR